ncbi:MBL fold metallo-hydrolase [Roseobacter weihaiensis]|uniref:MBL fold metallo-hydrolase n=1 Tax=Roseobacter weihaiensis TaxID=2763262 RepID=UPI001D0AF93B|nr:MBL fold metallo-hydrolase [Roseobacter sp. H9]
MTLGPLPHMTPKTIGSLQVFACVDSAGPTRLPSELLKNVPAEATAPEWLAPYLAADGRMIMAYQSFVLKLGARVIVVDCAVGEDGNFPARPDWHEKKSNWLAHLGLAGVTPDQVDTVFLTHLHMDHTGWLTRKNAGEWVPTFPNARHLVSQIEFDFWTTRHQEFPYMSTSIPDSVAPAADAGLIEIVVPGAAIAEGLQVVDLAGHSPGMIGLEYTEGGSVLAAFNADLMHHPFQLAHPQCPTLFCSDPDAAIETRRAKLAQYADARTVMFNNHFPGECAGRAVRAGDGYQFVPSD